MANAIKGKTTGGKEVELHRDKEDYIVRLDDKEIGRGKDLKELEAQGFRFPSKQEEPKKEAKKSEKDGKKK